VCPPLLPLNIPPWISIAKLLITKSHLNFRLGISLTSRQNPIRFAFSSSASSSSTADLGNLNQPLANHDFPSSFQAPHLALQYLVLLNQCLMPAVYDVVADGAPVDTKIILRLERHAFSQTIQMAKHNRLSVFLAIGKYLQRAGLALCRLAKLAHNNLTLSVEK
jgi:hypothetical protein